MGWDWWGPKGKIVHCVWWSVVVGYGRNEVWVWGGLGQGGKFQLMDFVYINVRIWEVLTL